MAEAALEVRDLRVSYGRREIVRGVSFEARHGEIVALLGPNGAGKSTLLRALLGLVPYEGEVRLGGRSLDAMDVRERARAIAYVPQHGLLATSFSVEDVVFQGRFAHGAGPRPSARDRAAVEEAIRIARVEPLRHRAFTELSHGERRRVLVARALATEARIIVLDEPDAFLDVGQALSLFALLRGLADRGFAVVAVLHGLDDVMRVADRAILLHEGTQRAAGPPAEVLSPENLARVYGVRAHGAPEPTFALVDGEPPLPAATTRLPEAPRATERLPRRFVGPINAFAALAALALGAILVGPPAAFDAGDARDGHGSSSAIVDATGRRFVPKPYRRIVSASVTADQILAEIVEPSRVVAVSSYGKARPPVSIRFADRPVIDDLGDIEPIVALAPDLVLVNNFMRASVVERLREAGIEVFDLGELGGAAEFAEDVLAIGALLGIEDRARAMAARYRDRLARIAADRPRETRPTGVYVRVLGGSIYGGGAGTSYHDVLEYGGLRDLAAERFRGWPTYDPETLLELDPDYLVTKEGGRRWICDRDGLRALRACKEGNIVELADDLLDDAGLGIEDAALAVRQALGD